MIHRFETYREFFAAVDSNARKVVRVREGGRTVEVRVAK